MANEMIEPRVNGALLSTYGAKMLDYSVGGVSYKNGYAFTPRAFFPIATTPQIGVREITIELDFDEDWQNNEAKISDFAALLAKGAELLLPDGFLYTVIYTANDAPTRPAPWITTVSFELDGVRHGALEQVTLTAPGTITVKGNRTAPARLTVSDISGTVTVAGITIEGLTGEVVIDGIARTVTQNGENVFGNTDLTEFPTVTPGAFDVDFSDGLTVLVEYYPLYM